MPAIVNLAGFGAFVRRKVGRPVTWAFRTAALGTWPQTRISSTWHPNSREVVVGSSVLMTRHSENGVSRVRRIGLCTDCRQTVDLPPMNNRSIRESVVPQDTCLPDGLDYFLTADSVQTRAKCRRLGVLPRRMAEFSFSRLVQPFRSG
jgi:hypothetical protein